MNYYLYEQNKPYMELRKQDFQYMEQKHHKLKQQKEHQQLLQLQQELQFQDLESQQQKKRKITRELACIQEGMRFNASYDLRGDQNNQTTHQEEDEFIKKHNQIIPKSVYIENINENMRKFPSEENMVYVS